MKPFKLEATNLNPEIVFNHDKKEFHIRGVSRPEDVREIYFPVVEWLLEYRSFLNNESPGYYSESEPMVLEVDLEYFNSSSAKFLYDIVQAIKQIDESGVHTSIAWVSDEEDTDMKEAGEDLAYLAEIDFVYITK